MSHLDTFLAAATGHAHTTADLLLDTALYYGPGVLATAAMTAAWHTCRWAVDRHHQRADRRYYTARAFRLNQVADRADAFLAMPDDLITARLEAHYAATPNLATEGEER